MKKLLDIVPRWLPAILIMAFIFYTSSLPGWGEPRTFSLRDYLSPRKVAHVLAYGFLALSYLRILAGKPNRYFLAWLFALLFAVSDELHQSFVPNRNGSLIDVLVFDNIGALTALFWHWLRKGRFNMESDSSLSKMREQAP